ncbi:MAG TPA: DNA polymerase III subunit beta [Anaerolineales bacterium]|nr:DNA polymerase III subunit beta [Anaerolineales bacterium]
MKVEVLQEVLNRGLSIIHPAIQSRSTLPVLANVLIATDEGRLRLSATDLELGITCWIGAKIEDEGSTTVPFKTFSELVGTLPDAKVSLSLNTDNEILNIRSGSSKNDIKGIDADEFPIMPVPNFDDAIMINVADFREMVQQVAFAASMDEARPVLMGVLIKFEETTITMAAADGFRLSVRSAALSEPVKNPFKVIVPSKALQNLSRIATNAEEPIQMVLPKGRGQVVFRVKDAELTSQLIDGSFPDYQQIIPQNLRTKTIVSTESLLKACKQAEIFAREGTNVVKLDIQGADDPNAPGTMIISAQSEETGKNETMVSCVIDGDPILIAFNVKYLREVLEVVRTGNVVIQTSAPNAPGLITSNDNLDFQHVIMPMHLG